MGTFNQNITVSKDAYKEVRHEEMDRSIEDAFNHILFHFSSIVDDKSYNDDYHKILSNENGEQYYFDSFKYIYSMKDKEDVVALNNNLGPGKFSIVTTHGAYLVIENYDCRMGTVEVELARMTEQSLSFMNSFYKDAPNKKSEFVFQVSGGFNPCVETLAHCSKITISKNEFGTLVCENENGEVLEQVLATDKSFYKDCISSFNYTDILVKEQNKGRQR